MADDELLPCPFCGAAAERIDIPAVDNGDPRAGGSCIECTSCSASSALHFDRKENLIASWNRRAIIARLDQRDELLAAAKDAESILVRLSGAGLLDFIEDEATRENLRDAIASAESTP